MKILIVEDEEDLSGSIEKYLKEEGFLCELAFDYETASYKINDYAYDVVVVDIMLPDGTGLGLIRDLKTNNPDSGVIVISAKNSLDDKLIGLDLGADDYISKPFHLAELNARLKSVIRRRKFEGKKKITVNEIEILPESQLVKINDSSLDLTKKEYDLLLYFIANQNRVLLKESIAEHLWGDSIDMIDSFDFIYTHIRNLKKKMNECNCKNYIKSIYGQGYKFDTQ